ncbi:MAG: hypothetical protein ACOZNI_08105 [Myxococcota bacterium]
MVGLLLSLVAHTAAAPLGDCERRFDAADLLEAVRSADVRFVALDAAGFEAARAAVRDRLACVGEPLSGATIGAVHRVEAMGAFLDGDPPAVALAGLLAADPGYQLPASLVPEGHPIRAAFGPAKELLRDSRARPLPALVEGWIEVDGSASTSVPATRAAVLQQIDAQGRVVETRYARPEDPVGGWTGEAVPVAARRSRAPVAVAAGASLVAAGGLYLAAAGSQAAFADRSIERDEAELAALRTRTNALTVGWVAAGAATAGLAVAFAWPW